MKNKVPDLYLHSVCTKQPNLGSSFSPVSPGLYKGYTTSVSVWSENGFWMPEYCWSNPWCISGVYPSRGRGGLSSLDSARDSLSTGGRSNLEY